MGSFTRTQYENYFQGFITLLDILNKLSNSDYINLNDSNFEEINENQQLKRLFNFVKYNFKDEIALNQASEKVSMTTPAFCRYFKNTGKHLLDMLMNTELIMLVNY